MVTLAGMVLVTAVTLAWAVLLFPLVIFVWLMVNW